MILDIRVKLMPTLFYHISSRLRIISRLAINLLIFVNVHLWAHNTLICHPLNPCAVTLSFVTVTNDSVFSLDARDPWIKWITANFRAVLRD